MSEREKQHESSDAGAVELEEAKLDEAAGGIKPSDIPITKPIDKSTPILF